MRLSNLIFAAALGVAPLMSGSTALAASMDPFSSSGEDDQAINRAVALYRQGDLDAAEDAVRSFLLLNPTSARGYEVLGAIQGRRGDDAASLQALDTAVRLDPKLATAHANRAVILVSQGELDSARRALEEAVAIDPGLYPAHARLGRVLEAQGDLDGAARHYELWLEGADELEPGQRVNLAAIYNARGDFDRTVALLSLWQRDREVDARLHTLLADAYVGLDRGSTALRQYRFAVEAAPDDPRPRIGLGIAHRRLEDFEEALRIFESLEAQYPDSPAPRIQLAETYVAMNERPEAEIHYNEAIEIAEAPAPVQNRLAAVLMAWGRPAEAEALYRAVIDANGPDPELFGSLAASLNQQGDSEGARAIYREAIDMFGEATSQPYVMLGLFERSQADPAAALTTAESGLNVHPGDSLLLRIAATSARDLNELRRAIRYGEQILELNPNNFGDKFIFATLLDKARVDERAEDLYREVASAQRNNWAAMNNLSLVLARNENFKEALTFSRRALQLQPDNPAVQHTAGWVLYLNGRLGEAETLMRKSAEALPDVAEVRYHMGKILLARGDPSGARVEFQAGLRLDPAHEEAAEVRDILNSL